ncbi:unnamed protein product [Camellia sinensis]
MDSSQNMSNQAGQAKGQAQQKGNQMMDKASNAAQSSKESLQEWCGFVKYFHREMAMAAINVLNGIYTMKGCDQPLIVRFADPKRPRAGDPRGLVLHLGSRFWSSVPTTRSLTNTKSWRAYAWSQTIRFLAFHESSEYGAIFKPWCTRFWELVSSSVWGYGSAFYSEGGPLGVHDGSADGVLSACAVSSSTSQQSFNQSLPQVPLIGQQQISQVQRPLQSPQELPSYMQTQTPLQQHGQLQIPQSAGQTPFSHALLGLGGQLFVSQPQVQQNASSVQQAAMNSNLHPHHPSATANEQQLPLQQSASQFAQMLSQQKQTLQASFQSSQQAFSQLQQQFQLIQPSNQNLMSHQFSQATKQQKLEEHRCSMFSLVNAQDAQCAVIIILCNHLKNTDPFVLSRVV